MIEIIIVGAISAVSTGWIVYWYLKPRLNKIEQINYENLEYNRSLESERYNLQGKINDLYSEHQKIEFSIQNAKIELDKLKYQEEQTREKIKTVEEQAEEAAQIFYRDKKAIAEANFAQALSKARDDYQNAIDEYQKEFLQTLEEASSQMSIVANQKRTEIEELDQDINQLRNTAAAAIESAKRAEEIRQQADFYKLHLTDTDIQEIEMLRNVTPYLKDKEALNKVIWKVYYEKPTSDLINRVIGSKIITGIYKITNLNNEMCYVGQSTDIASRWKQHIKRGLGAETPTRNKLYPAMLTVGVENFSFELIEECSKERLDEREDYWQDYFQAREFGYSIK